MLHPLSLFPALFSYPFLAYFLLRVVVAWAILRIGAVRWKSTYKYFALVDLVVGALVLIGLYTQGALIIVMILLAKEYYLDFKAGLLDQKNKTILFLIFVIALALLFLGPGAFALDYPL